MKKITTRLPIYLMGGASMLFAGCAKHTNEIPAHYVSPMQYEGYQCKQIGAEMQSISRRLSELGAQVDKTASDDSAQMGVGLLLLWPTLFFLDGDTPQAQEYGRLKGEFEALEKAGIQKNCGLVVERPQITAPQPAQPKKGQYPGE